MTLPNAPWVAQPSDTDAPFLKTSLSSSDSRNLDGDASGPSEIGKAMDAVGSTTAMQPMTVKTSLPISMATGDPVTDAINTAKDIMEFPSRLSQTMGEISGSADEATKTHLEAMGLHPAIAWALGKAAGLVTDPRNLAMFGEGGVPNLESEDLPKIGNIGGDQTTARAVQAESRGVNLSPAEASGSKMMNILEDLGNIYPYTGDDFQNFYKTRLEAADNIRARLLDSVGNNAATKQVSQMMRSSIDSYLQNAAPEQSAYLNDRMGDLETFMKKPGAGQFTQSMLAQQRKIALDVAGDQFDALRKIVPDEAPIKTPSFSAKAKELLDQEMQGKVSDQNPAWVKRLAEYAGVEVDDKGIPLNVADGITQSDLSPKAQQAIKDQLAAQSPKSDGSMPFGGTQMTMRKLRDLRIANDPGYLLGIKGQGNTYAGYAAELRKALHDDIEGGLTNLSDQSKQALAEAPPSDPAIASHLQQMSNVADQYKAAKVNYAQTKELMNDPFIIKLLKNNPEEFLDHAVKAQDITNIGKLKQILGPDNFAPVQHNLLANMLVDKTGELNPQSFVKKVDRIGFPTLTKVFDPQTLYEIGQAQDIFSSMKRGFAENSQTAGRLMAKAALFGVPTQAMTLLFTGHPIAAGATLLGSIGVPKALARLYLSDAGRELLIKGMTVPQSAATALSVLGKTAMMSATENARSSAEQ